MKESPRLAPHLAAVLQALFVSALWSTSWVLIKLGLRDIPALTFAGLRYSLAVVCLVPFLFVRRRPPAAGRVPAGGWLRLAALGVLFYGVTQGAQFVALAYLPAVTVSLFLSFTPIAVAVLGVVFLAERPAGVQWAGAGLFLAGAAVYFLPVAIEAGQSFGLLVAAAGVLANAASSVLGRHINRAGEMSTVTVTVVSMAVGATVLLAGGVLVQGLPRLDIRSWALVGWLAVVNTAFAFTLWNHTLRTLPAVESSIINNTMLVQIAVLAWVFLGEPIGWKEGIGLLVAAAGAVLVQLARPRPAGNDAGNMTSG